VYLALLVAVVLIGPAAWEANLREWLYAHTERAQFAMGDLLELGETVAPVLIAMIVLVLFATRHRGASFFLLAAAGGAAILSVATQAIAGLFSSDAGDFPSGQASGSAGVATAFVLLLWDRPHRLLIVLAGIAAVGLNGFVLVATNWHGPSEVVGGWCLAVAWVTGIWIGVSRLRAARVSPATRDELRRPRWDAGQERSLEPSA
jgi:undecaprenyl-diphosphatase